MKKADWPAIVRLTTQCYGNCKFVVCDDDKFYFQYVGDSRTRRGYLTIWNPTNKKATRVLNIVIPDGINFIGFDDAESFDQTLPEGLTYEFGWY
jgi:hypothetical protein